MASTRTLPAQCCTLPPFHSDYEPNGETLIVKGRDGLDMNVYSVGPKDAKHALICVYDIFGHTPNTAQGADLLAREKGYRVVIPDVFREKPWDHTNFPPPGGIDVVIEWCFKIGTWDLVKPDMVATIDLLKREEHESIGVRPAFTNSFAL